MRRNTSSTPEHFTTASPMRRWGLVATFVLAALPACGQGSDGQGESASGGEGKGKSVGTGGGSTSGGVSTTGGEATVTGGADVGTGGMVVGSGGDVASGATGGMSTGGMSAGGMSTGGMSTGGMSTGGMSTGGMSTGGMSTGGMSTGGMSTGGTSAGGMSTGGTGGTGAGGSGGTGGDNREASCDIYQAADTPCVAAHSTVRALYGAYTGSLYQLRRASDGATEDVPVGPEGFADISVQDTFCAGTTCTISIIYDQSPNHNDLPKSPPALWLPDGGNEANAADGEITVNGHTVHGIYVTGYSSDVGYRATDTTGIATGDEPESMYMVVDGRRYSDQCCFDYGNATPSGNADGNGTMEAVYFGNDITWGGRGEGDGPWVAADLEFGVYKSDQGGWQSQDVYTPSAKSIVADFATAMLKGPSGNHFTLKAGDAQSGTLTTMWDGPRPSGAGYSPKRLEGAIILGTGGDGSNGGTGTFFEGAMTFGVPPDEVDDAVQANIVAAGYGR